MKDTFNKTKNMFILLQCSVFVLVVLACILFIAFHYVKQTEQVWAMHFDRTAKFIIDQIKDKKDFFPVEGQEDYQVFIINAEDGSYVVERAGWSDADRLVWEAHRTKLIYQMQKQRMGWIFYPDKGPWGFFQDSRAIRFFSLEENGWLVAVETFVDSQATILKTFFVGNLNKSIAMILVIGLLALGYLANKNSGTMKRMVSDSYESRLMSLHSEDVWGDKAVTSKIEEKLEERRSVGIDQDDFSDEDIEDKPQSQSEPVKKLPPIVEKPDSSGIDQPKTPVIKQNPPQPRETDQKKDSEEGEKIDDLKIETSGIESPLLKKTNNEISEGSPHPRGTTLKNDGVNFAVFSKFAKEVFLLLFDKPDGEPTDIIQLKNRSGNIWHVFVHGIKAGQLYGYKVAGEYDPAHAMRFNKHKLLIDPYAKALTGKAKNIDNLLLAYDPNSPQKDLTACLRDNTHVVPKSIVIDDAFDWQDDKPPHIPLEDLIIYEVHLKGFTAHPSSGVKHPGTYLGFIEKIPHLKELGINAVELLPIHESSSLLRFKGGIPPNV